MAKWAPCLGFWANRGLPEPQPEYKFHPTRKWRFDFAWEKLWIAIEVEGGIWNFGRHVRGSGFMKDMEKYNEATRLGWKVYRFTPSQMNDPESVGFFKSVLK